MAEIEDFMVGGGCGGSGGGGGGRGGGSLVNVMRSCFVLFFL